MGTACMMFETLLLLTLAPSLLEAVWYEQACTQIEDEGFYCTADLKRVHDCVYVPDDMYLGLRREITCPEGTRCSCNLDYPCSSNRTSDICKPFETPAPFVESFAMNYRWHRFHKSLNPHVEDYQDYEESKGGEIIRDKGGYFKKVGPDAELVVKRGDGLFTKYAWNDKEKNKCKTSEHN